MDYAVRLISLEDDPSLPIFTFRMWFLALGLSCFGAILSQIFVRIYLPFTTNEAHTTTVLPPANDLRQSTVLAGESSVSWRAEVVLILL